jgi:uncharacterized membrane protein
MWDYILPVVLLVTNMQPKIRLSKSILYLDKIFWFFCMLSVLVALHYRTYLGNCLALFTHLVFMLLFK